MSFLNRLFHQLVNQFLVDALANSRTFQRFAVRSNEFFKDISENGLGFFGDFRQAFTEEMKKNFVKESMSRTKTKL